MEKTRHGGHIDKENGCSNKRCKSVSKHKHMVKDVIVTLGRKNIEGLYYIERCYGELGKKVI